MKLFKHKRLPHLEQGAIKQNQFTTPNPRTRTPADNNHNHQYQQLPEPLVDKLAEVVVAVSNGLFDKMSGNNNKNFKMNHKFNTQPRDKNIILPYSFNQKGYFSLKEEQQKLTEWLGQMHFLVVSCSFELFLKKELTYSETKVYCCENLLINLLLFYERVVKDQLFEIARKIDKVLQNNLNYLLSKYPQAKEVKPNKKLRDSIVSLNNLESDENQMISLSGVDFKLKKNQDYTPEIMNFINFLITKQSEIVSGSKKTYFQQFYDMMESIFQSVQYPEMYTVNQSINAIINIMGKQDIPKRQEDSLGAKQAKDYREKVKSYTNYKIDQKIKPDTPLFTAEEIETGQFIVKSTSILRIITKWIDQLQNKIIKADQLILKRLFKFKNRTMGMIKLGSGQKNDLYQESKKQIIKMDKLLKQIQQSCFQIEGMLAVSSSVGYKSIPKLQFMVGNFCSKVQNAASSYMFTYLNRTVHYLLEIPYNARKKYEDDEFMLDELNINLITFKVGDLFRCKCSSHQFQILRIFNALRSASQETHKIKIVRVKDRLEMGTRDILINVIFMNTFLCEIQLAVVDEIDQKQQMYDKFNHFLYELKRSVLGSVMESACIWSHLDQRSSKFKFAKSKDNLCFMMSSKKHLCLGPMIDYNLAFVCSLCGGFYPSQSGIFRNRRCSQCKRHYQCRSCFQTKMNEQELKKFLKLDSYLGIFQDDFSQWKPYQNEGLPKLGIIFSRKIKTMEAKFYNIITLKNQDKIVVMKEDCAEVVASFKNQQKDLENLCNNFIIFGWNETRNINRTICSQKNAKNRRDKRIIDIGDVVVVQSFCKMFGNQVQMRVAIKEESGIKYCLILQSYKNMMELKRMIRQKHNIEIIKNMLRNKMEVIFLEQESIFDELNLTVNDLQLHINLLNVRQIYLDDNLICDLDFVEYMPALSVAHFNRNSITQMGPVEKLINLKQLMLDKNQITYISELNNLTLLTEFSIMNNKITELQNLNYLKSLESLKLFGNKLRYISQLEELKNIVSIDLSYNQISQIQNLSQLTKLSQLDLSGNKLSSISGLQNLTSLINLDLEGNNIEKIQGLTNLTNLIYLQLSDNYISKIQNLQSQTKLTKLILSKNKITCINNIQHLIYLKVLDLCQNQLKTIQNLQQNQNLTKLDISFNFLRKVPKILVDSKFDFLTICNLSDNPFYENQENAAIIEKLKQKILKNKHSKQDNQNIDIQIQRRVEL